MRLLILMNEGEKETEYSMIFQTIIEQDIQKDF